MITSKQRSFLRSMAHNLDPVVYIGKFGVTENVEKEIDNCLENRELVKVKLQEGCDLAAKDVANEMADKLGAEFVQAIGHKFTLYRESKENKQIVLPRSEAAGKETGRNRKQASVQVMKKSGKGSKNNGT